MNKQQEALYNVLSELKQILEENDLQYFLMYGTLIGAMRHKGFIPWDDDIDISMPREDFERFRKIADKCLPKHLKVVDYDNTKDYCQTFIKVHNINTAYVEEEIKDNKNLWTGVFVDIYPMDYLPSNKFLKSYYDFIYKLLCHLNNFIRRKASNNISETFKNCLLKIIKLNTFTELLTKLSLKNKNRSDQYFDSSVASFFYKTDTIYFNINSFNNSKALFEKEEFNIPLNYDDVLKTIYGDWRKLPPIEEQVAKHTPYIEDLNKSYKEYL